MAHEIIVIVKMHENQNFRDLKTLKKDLILELI